MAVVGRALLLTVDRADRTIHVEHDELRRVTVMNPFDPNAREIYQRGEVARARQPFRLETAHLAGRRRLSFGGFAYNNSPHCKITPETVGAETV